MIFKNLLLIDGINRAGKNAIIDAITSFKRSESIEMNYVFEHIVEGISLNLITKEYAKSFFEKFLNEIAYNKFLGRNANFRKKDKSSIQNFSFPEIYRKRLLQNENSKKIFQKLKKTKNFFPFMTHEVLSNLDTFDDLKINYKMIAIFRNPYDLIYSWKKKKIVEKLGNDNFTLTFNNKNEIYPWYVYHNSKKWLNLKEMDKISIIILNLLDKSIKNYKKSKNKKNIFLIKYEDYISQPVIHLKKISKFMKTKFSSQTNLKLKKLNLPKDIKILEKKRQVKINFIKKNVNQRLFKKIQLLEKSYAKNFYGLNLNEVL